MTALGMFLPPEESPACETVGSRHSCDSVFYVNIRFKIRNSRILGFYFFFNKFIDMK